MWKLYNTGCMDFHLFFCCANVKRLAASLPEEEGLAVRPLWQVAKPPSSMCVLPAASMASSCSKPLHLLTAEV